MEPIRTQDTTPTATLQDPADLAALERLIAAAMAYRAATSAFLAAIERADWTAAGLKAIETQSLATNALLAAADDIRTPAIPGYEMGYINGRRAAYMDCANIVKSTPTWVEADSYRAQVDMKARIGAAIQQLSTNIKGPEESR